MKLIATILASLLFVAQAPMAQALPGYTANITNEQTLHRVYICVNAYHSTDDYYNTCDIEIEYDAEKLRFDSENSTLGCAMYRDYGGKLRLIDFGADKPLGESIYVLAFEVIGKGKTEVRLCSASFSTKEKAATSDIEPITNEPNKLTIWLQRTDKLIAVESGAASR